MLPFDSWLLPLLLHFLLPLCLPADPCILLLGFPLPWKSCLTKWLFSVLLNQPKWHIITQCKGIFHDRNRLALSQIPFIKDCFMGICCSSCAGFSNRVWWKKKKTSVGSSHSGSYSVMQLWPCASPAQETVNGVTQEVSWGAQKGMCLQLDRWQRSNSSC